MRIVRVLYLDDMEARHEAIERVSRIVNHDEPYEELDVFVDVQHAWTADQAIAFLKSREYDVCSLDHDLADAHYDSLEAALAMKGTGREVTQFLVDNPDRCPPFVNVHSWNPGGSVMMAQQVAEMKAVSVSREPFGVDSFAWLLRAIRNEK